MRNSLADYRFHLLAAAAIVAFVLGWIGYWQYFDMAAAHGQGEPPRLTDAAFASFKLFSLNAPDKTQLPPALDIARFLAPVVAGWAALSTIGLLFRDRLLQMRIPTMRNHVIICGLGHMGSVFVRHLRDHGDRVVVIETDRSNASIELCRDLGVPVVVGDAQSKRTLLAAGAARAGRLLAVSPRDAINTEIVAAARELTAHRTTPLECLAKISDPDLCALLRLQEARRGEETSSLDFFNIDEASARLLLDRFPPDLTREPHILIAHLDPLGEWVLWHAARDWYCGAGEYGATKLTVTVVDDDADERVASLLGRYPALEGSCRIICCTASVRDIRALPLRYAEQAVAPIAQVYVTAYQDEQAVETALVLRHEFEGVPIAVALARGEGVAALTTATAGFLDKIDMFQTMENTCTVELVKGGSWEAMARAVHYREREDASKIRRADRSWDAVPDHYKESSRARVRYVVKQLREIGFEIGPLRDWNAVDLITEDDAEKLARAEHDRWMRERFAQGYTFGERNEAKKTNPNLVPFDELDDAVKKENLGFARAIPNMLAAAGLQVVRRHAHPA
ncbi:MAG TPA: NAD-binding protein [Mycobacterium sp.]